MSCGRDGPCYRCVFPTPPPAAAVGSCNTNGVLAPLCGALGTLQAAEVVKLLVGSCGALQLCTSTLRAQNHRFVLCSLLCTAADVLSGRLFCVDWRAGTTRTVRLRERRAAQCCSRITALADYSSFCHGAFSFNRIAAHHLNTHTTRVRIAK